MNSEAIINYENSFEVFIFRAYMRKLIFIAFLLCSLQNFAQFLPVYDQFQFHEFIKNPAATGAELYPVINLSYRKQWWGIKQAPNTQIISVNMRLGKISLYNRKMMLNKDRFRAREQSGLGAAVFNDQNGPMENTGIIVSYAYHIPFRENSLSFGLAGTISNYRINNSLLNPTDPNDQALLDMPPKTIVPNANAGVYFYGEKYFTGFSLTEIFPQNSLDDDFYHDFRPNLFFTAGYRLKLAPGVLYEPSCEIRNTKKRDLVIDLNSKFYFGDAHWTGMNIRSDGNFGFYLGLNIRRHLYVAYLYEYAFGDIQTSFNNTHSIMLGQNIGLRSFSSMRRMRFK